MYKFVFLINPISGGGQGKVIHQYLPEIMSSLNYTEDQWKAEFTNIDGLDNQIRDALANTEKLVAVGGDGTVSSVLSCFSKDIAVVVYERCSINDKRQFVFTYYKVRYLNAKFSTGFLIDLYGFGDISLDIVQVLAYRNNGQIFYICAQIIAGIFNYYL